MPEIYDALMQSPEFTDFLFNNLTTAVFLVDSDFRVRKINETYRTLFAREESDVLNELCGNSMGCQFAEEQHKPCGSMSECANCQIRNCLVKTFKDGESVECAYLERSFYIDNEARKKNFRIQFRKIHWGGMEMAIVAIDDITELEENRRKIEEFANHDFLTGLYNRRGFFELSELIFQNARRGNISVAIAMFDIDNFKRVNDAYGHAAGDFVIKSVADVLTRNLRKADVLARFGGEEFCLLLHCKDNDDVYTVVDKLRLIIEQQSFAFEGKRIPITISAGLTSKLGDTLDDMIRIADETLYKAKNNGKNRTEEYAG